MWRGSRRVQTLTKPGFPTPTAVSDLADLQFDYIKLKLASRLDGVESSANGARMHRAPPGAL